MFKLLRQSMVLIVLFTVITGVLYPLAVTGIGRVVFPAKAQGSLVGPVDHPLGSALIGQPFSDPKYFWGRPSATSPQPYNGGWSSGSNQGPTNPALTQAVIDRISALHSVDPGNKALIPVDLVTASASGLDPQISPAAAAYQASRVARERGLALTKIQSMIAGATEGRQWGVLGEPRVNVLALNLALDSVR